MPAPPVSLDSVNFTPTKCSVNTKVRYFSSMPYHYPFPRPALTVDMAVFGYDGNALKLLVIERGLAPFKERWALPGSPVH